MPQLLYLINDLGIFLIVIGYPQTHKMKLPSLSSINLFNPSKILFFLWLFLLVFPKGGFKIGGIPITWGYLCLGIISMTLLARGKWFIHGSRFWILACLFPFQVITLGLIAANGFTDTGMFISFVISYIVLPYLFCWLLSEKIENLNLEIFFRLLKRGILFIAAYGSFLFVLKLTTGKFLELPFVTMNWGDMGELESKNIHRGGGIYKLISTYNNGNLYGVCLLMLLPLYCSLEKRAWRHLLVKLSLILALSRTVWAGLLIHEILYAVFLSKKRTSAILSIGAIFLLLVSVVLVFGFSLDFLLDTELGGRRGQFDVLGNLSLFSHEPFSVLHESTYMGILSSFGAVPFLLFILAMGLPLFICFYSKSNSFFHQCILSGLLNYLIISISDGASMLLPTMAFYWFLVSFLARKINPQDSQHFACPKPRRKISCTF